ncbi:hypothetical protein JW968_05560 [Candidatus Woesearchaeota archaeon]|nr:hypothetical protein [Candidatus Woesearchaeota archaeon]
MENQAKKKFEYHKKKFGIEDSEELRKFEKLLELTEFDKLECSVKLEDGKINANRFHLICWNKPDKDFVKIFYAIREFLQIKGINTEIITNMMPKLDLDRTEKIGVGIDLREKREESRAKIWFKIKDWPGKVEDIIIKYTKTKLEHLSDKKSLLFGIDFGFDGKNSVKTYVKFNEKAAKKHLSRETLELSGLSEEILVTQKDDEYIINFFTKERSKIAEKTGNKYLIQLNEQIDYQDGGFITLSEREIKQGEVRNATIYY